MRRSRPSMRAIVCRRGPGLSGPLCAAVAFRLAFGRDLPDNSRRSGPVHSFRLWLRSRGALMGTGGVAVFGAIAFLVGLVLSSVVLSAIIGTLPWRMSPARAFLT